MTIIIDGNAYLSVAVSVIKKILSKDRNIGLSYYVNALVVSTEFMLKQAAKDQFKRFTLKYLSSILYPFQNSLSSVIMVFDSKSWRKEYITQFMESNRQEAFEYKGTRVRDDKSYLFFDYFRENIAPNLELDYNLYTIKIDGAEGDDLIAYLSEEINSDICIWTVDKDIVQLVENSNRKVFVITPKMMTKYKRIYTTTDFDVTNDTTNNDYDLFNLDINDINNSAISNIVHNLIVDYEHLHIGVDPIYEILYKILEGDKSDNIPRIHPKLTSSRVRKLIDKIYLRFDRNILELIDLGDLELTNFIVDKACEILKISDESERQVLQDNLELNRTIMRLSTKVFPKGLINNMQNAINLDEIKPFNYFNFKKNIYSE